MLSLLDGVRPHCSRAQLCHRGGYLRYRDGRSVENKALNAIHAAQLTAATFGKTTKWSVPTVTAHGAPVRVRMPLQRRPVLVEEASADRAYHFR